MATNERNRGNKKWNPGVPSGEEVIDDDTQIDYPIDGSLYVQHKGPEFGSFMGSSVQDERDLDPSVSPEILNDLSSPIGTANSSGTIDVTFTTSEIPGAARYEVRISKV